MDFKNDLIQKISNYRDGDKKNYWKMVDKLWKLEQRNINDAEKIDAETWIHHYKKILGVDNINLRNKEL